MLKSHKISVTHDLTHVHDYWFKTESFTGDYLRIFRTMSLPFVALRVYLLINEYWYPSFSPAVLNGDFWRQCSMDGAVRVDLSLSFPVRVGKNLPSASIGDCRPRYQHRGKMHCARAAFLLLVNAPLLKTIGKNNKLGFRPRILKNLSSRHQT